MSDVGTDEFTDRPNLDKKRVIVDWIGEFFRFATLLVVLISLGILIIQGQTGEEARDRLISCTTPEGKCYQNSQENTAKAIAQIFQDGVNREVVTRETILAAAACAQRFETFDAIKVCVENKVGDINGESTGTNAP